MDLLKNLDNMITAKEFLKSKGCEFNTYDIGKCFDGVEIKDVIEFAKLHVEAALKAASEKVEWNGYTLAGVEIDKDSILDAYPLENIK